MIIQRACKGGGAVRAWEGDPWRSRLLGWTREACGGTEMRVWREFYGDGREVFVAVCEKCGRRAGELPQRALTEAQRTVLRGLTGVRADHRTDARTCMFDECGKPAQWHHYAPKGIFGFDLAHAYGTVPLCIEHHTLWHRVMDRRAAVRQAAA